METTASTLIRSKLQAQAQTLKLLKHRMGWRELIFPAAAVGYASWAQLSHHPQMVFSFGILFLGMYTFVNARIMHKRIDAIVDVIGDEALQRRMSGEIKEIADILPPRHTSEDHRPA